MPNAKGRRRRFGSIRATSLGEFQASYLGPDGPRYFAPHRFKRQRDADRWLAQAEALIVAGDWTNPERAKVPLGDYAEQWVSQRPALRPRTVELYRWLLGRYMVPEIGDVAIGSLTPAVIRQWRADLMTKRGVSATMAAKAYRLAAIRAELVAHLAEFVDAGPDALVFTGVQGRALRRGPWSQRVKWPELVVKLGLTGVHFHDLRHAGNIWRPRPACRPRT